MIKMLLMSSLSCAVLLLSGCGDNEAESRLQAQQALDKGDYATAISSLESKTNKTAEDNMVLASSYMGKAGFSFTDTISIVSKSVSSNSVDTDNFANFSKNIADTKDANTLENLQKAIDYYTAVDQASSSRSFDTNLTIGDRDLYLGLAYLTKATVAVSYLGDVAKLQSSQLVGNELLASSCAIVTVYAPTASLPNGCTKVSKVPKGNYTQLDIILDNGNGKTFSRLANANATELFLTDYSADTLVPIQVKSKDVTIKDVLVDTINDAFTLITKIAPVDMRSDIDKFKNEIGVDAKGKISSQTLSDYLTKKK